MGDLWRAHPMLLVSRTQVTAHLRSHKQSQELSGSRPSSALRHHSYHVQVHKRRHLANILFEDEFQVAAYPSERDGKITVR
jgi:hypothetical protein